MIEEWNKKSTFDKVLDIISGIALCIWLIFEVLERTNKVQWAEFVNCIAICVVCLCQVFSFWKIKRIFSYIAIAGAVCMIAVIILKIM